MNFSLLYIDPGTGSALFSILIGAAAAIYFLGRALLLKLKFIFSGGKSIIENVLPYVIYCEGKQYYNVFKPVLDEFEKRNIELLYLTSSKDDPVFDKNWNFIKSEYIGEGNQAFSRLNILKAEICLMTTPGLNVFQLKRSKMTKHYSHILHAPGDAVTYRLFGIDYYDSVLLTGDYQAKDIRILEKQRNLPEKKLITVGCTYLDEYAEKIKNIQPEHEHPFTVLVSPTWGQSGLLAKYGEKLLDPLVKTGFRIIVRPHPQSKVSEKSILETLTLKYKEKVIWDFEIDNLKSLIKADIMISDFSGIIFDFVFLCDKPVFYINQSFDLRPYDAYDLGDNAIEDLWQFQILKDIGIELKEEYLDNIGNFIKDASENKSLKLAREKAIDTAWQFRGEAGKLVTDFMINTVNNA